MMEGDIWPHVLARLTYARDDSFSLFCMFRSPSFASLKVSTFRPSLFPLEPSDQHGWHYLIMYYGYGPPSRPPPSTGRSPDQKWQSNTGEIFPGWTWSWIQWQSQPRWLPNNFPLLVSPSIQPLLFNSNRYLTDPSTDLIEISRRILSLIGFWPSNSITFPCLFHYLCERGEYRSSSTLHLTLVWTSGVLKLVFVLLVCDRFFFRCFMLQKQVPLYSRHCYSVEIPDR
jgi:hypothetical protein